MGFWPRTSWAHLRVRTTYLGKANIEYPEGIRPSKSVARGYHAELPRAEAGDARPGGAAQRGSRRSRKPVGHSGGAAVELGGDTLLQGDRGRNGTRPRRRRGRGDQAMWDHIAQH